MKEMHIQIRMNGGEFMKKKLNKKFRSNPTNLEQYAVCKSCIGRCMCYCSSGEWNSTQIRGNANDNVHDFPYLV